MMQESKLTNFQQRHLEKQLRGGQALPLQCNPTSSAKKKTPKTAMKPPKYLTPKNYKSSVRSKEAIEASGAYVRPQYEPGPSHWNKNSQKEKEKLANIMAFGQETIPQSQMKIKPQQRDEYEAVAEIDRFAELQQEIAERREFLQVMEAIGQSDKHRTLIETQISQAIREMELIDKKKSRELEELIAMEQSKKRNEKTDS